MNEIDFTPMAIVGGAVLCVVVALYFMIQEGREWERFAAAHTCHVTQRMSGTTTAVPIFDSKGGFSMGVSSTPDKTAYLCDDGITYWR